MISESLDRLYAEAKAFAKNDGSAEVSIAHVLKAVVVRKPFVDALKEAGIQGVDLLNEAQKEIDALPKISQETVRKYKDAGIERRVRENMTLVMCRELAVKTSETVWITGQTEVSHFMLGLLAHREENPLNKMLRTSTQRNKFINALIASEAKALGKRVQHIEFHWADEETSHNEGEESEFSTYYSDLLAKASDDDKPFIGRESEISDLMNCLERKDKPNAILTGPPGVGKTDIVRGLAKKIVDGDVPEQLKDVNLYLVDVPAMLAGSQFRGQFEERLKGTIEELSEKDRPILFLDEIHTVLGAGSSSGSSMDAANILKPYLTDGKIRVIGATTQDEYRKYVESDSAFMRRFQNINVSEPSAADTVKILKGIKISYEEFHGVKVPVAACESAVNLSVRHMHDRFLPDKAIDIMDQTCARVKLRGDKRVTVDDIEETVSALCHVPKQNMKKDDLAKVRNLDKKLSDQVFGQDKAIEKLTEAIQMSKAGLNDPSKPIGSFLFVGPSGVGKTEVAKQLAAQLGIEFIRFDMSEYQEAHTVAKLIGSPAGYVGYDDGGILVEQIRQHPHCVVLFDEIEKAHPDVYKIFLQMMDYGMLTDSKGRKADFRNTVIIMTSNAGNSIVEKHVGFTNTKRTVEDKSMEAIESLMPPEMRGRMTAIVSFNPLNEQVAKLVVKKELKTLTARLKTKGIAATYSDNAISEIIKRGVSAQYGAREIQRVIDRDIKTLFVREIINGNLSGDCQVDFVDDKFVINKTEVVDVSTIIGEKVENN